MAISERRMQIATNEYNSMMYFLGLDVLTVGTGWQDGWNLADMVEECRWQLEGYSWEGHICHTTLHQLDGVKLTLEDLLDRERMSKHLRMMKEVQWAKDGMAKLNAFIKKWGKLTDGIECTDH